MKSRGHFALLLAGSAVALTSPARAATPERVKTANGIVVGAAEENGVRAFRGIPFAQPPAGGVIRGADAPNVPPRPPARGAVHSAEIEYAMGNLASNKVYAWTPDDHQVSATLQGYFANFIKTGDPNGSGLPAWPAANRGSAIQLMRVDVATKAEPDRHRERYLFLDEVYSKK